MIIKIESEEEKESIAENILRDLPEWFGLEESTKEYIENSKKLDFFADDKKRAFMVLKSTSPYTIELYLLGVLKEFQGKGIGKELFSTVCSYARNKGYKFMQVKTVKEGLYKEYDRTIKFYRGLGFVEFECFPELWDKWNPCQIFILSLDS